MEKTLLNAVMGILTVFCILIVISILISAFRFIAYLENKKTTKLESVTDQFDPQVHMPTIIEPIETKCMNEELVAVIAAAISAQTGLSTQDFCVRSIKRR